MSRRWSRIAAFVAALVAAVGCGGGTGPGDAVRPCAGLLSPAVADAALPSGVPTGIAGATLYAVQRQGATRRHLGWVAAGDLVGVRDRISAAYAAAGLEVLSADEEPPAEAEFQWRSADREGSVQVTPLCDGHLHLRYRIGPR